MLRVATIVTVALGVILTSSGVTAAAQPVLRVLRWGGAVDGAVAPGGARTYRLFEETDELSLTFTFFNQSSDSLSADLREFGKGVQIQVRMQPDQLEKLDEWARGQADKPSRPEAVRRLMLAGLRLGEAVSAEEV